MATVHLSCQFQRQSLRPVVACTPLLHDSSFSQRINLSKKNEEVMFQGVCLKKIVRSKTFYAAGGNGEVQINPLSPSDSIIQFYNCINRKNPKKLEKFISQDCYFEDYSFLKPFEGKKEVVGFFEQLMECMGKNVRFIIESQCEGDNLSIAVTWRLVWKDQPIPFTKGCSFYEFSKQGDQLLIKNARAMIESPIKPGPLALNLLKLMTNVFDEFPGATEKFLQRPHAVMQFLLRIYSLFLEPFVRPILGFYIIIWKSVVRLLYYVLNVLTIFFK
ncbi:hypothetical protein GIB67_008319 [Kingdonia uniflora]|uniref:SnoaL-like domain-containing protein n=1 Tax=Kingdonia uniflora TaxID=39325 RepID=A0A7J7N5A0_9MAGN|nr:hypothetical protein GIB67_008319 [Kingdonia uniflora]